MNRYSFDGRVAIVTGAGRGIGRAYALLLAERGASVVVNDLGGSMEGAGADAGVAPSVAGEIVAAGGAAVADDSDVSTADGAQALVDAAVEQFGRLDILINNAGIIRWAGLPDADADNLASHLAVHVVGLVQHRPRGLAAHGRAGLRPHRHDHVDGDLRAAREPLVRHRQGGGDRADPQPRHAPAPRHGIRVNLIAPAAFTRMAGQAPDEADRGRLDPMAPELVAPMVAFLAHEACPVSGEIYAAGAGRFARIFIASTPGYVHPTPAPTIEDVAAALGRHQRRGRATTSPPTSWPGRRPSWPTLPSGDRTPTRRPILMDFSLSEAERELVELCRDFAQSEIATRAPLAWEEARCPTDLLREMGELGLLGMLIPEEWGGIGMSTIGFVAAMEQIGLADQSVAAAWQAHVTIGSLPLYLFGNDAQRERWLRPLAEGRALGAFGLTEPDAGSDARGIRTRAERRDGGWLINGRKTFISNAGTDMSFGVTLLARIESADGEAPRFASFVVEKDTPGFTMGPKMRGIGWRGLDTRELYFDDVWVPDDISSVIRTWGSASSCARSRWGASPSPRCRSA